MRQIYFHKLSQTAVTCISSCCDDGDCWWRRCIMRDCHRHWDCLCEEIQVSFREGVYSFQISTATHYYTTATTTTSNKNCALY